ncbi:S-adenosylmethionine:tRNA ribosyltransferase-isomerase [Nocardioides sp. LHG3406-4]|uniref:S-adenosylmethionine:tRNA ribosyltransferase-isomerase n=1 Tax=Nocardioides sp. LHG3406-4 TaxID=2804575 RepID=UPI003CF79EE3
MTVLTEHPATRFPMPEEATAPAPPEARGLARDQVRLLVARPDGVVHARFRDLPRHLEPGDLVVVNTSATVPAEADATLGGRAVVVHVASRLEDGFWVVELRTAPDAARAILDARPGDRVASGPVELELLAAYPHEGSSPTGTGSRLWRAFAHGDLRSHLDGAGRPIAYGYLDRRYPLSAYQSVFASEPGSAEMASAGRPFTHALLTRLIARGVGVAPITLHTGVSSQEVGEGPQPEWFDVPAATARMVDSTRAAGGRVVAVGTTVTRALESAVGQDGRIGPARGWTERIVTPADPPRVVDGLVTGWHDPQASHLLLVEAVAGPPLTQAAYDAAVARHYRWHEFGDSALLLP